MVGRTCPERSHAVLEQELRQSILIVDHVGNFELHVIVGQVVVEVEDEGAVEELRNACERALPFSFEFKRGHFIKRKPTLTDYAKYGFRSRTDERINLEDERLLGLTDPYVKERDLCIIQTER